MRRHFQQPFILGPAIRGKRPFDPRSPSDWWWNVRGVVQGFPADGAVPGRVRLPPQMAGGEEQWCAIVLRNGGLNQAGPTPSASEFHDHNGAFPIPTGTTAPISTVTEPRYRFWGLPGYWYDGHCINFLEYQGRIYLYDACFGFGSVEIQSSLPPDNLAVAQGGAALAPFRAAYLDGAVDFMLGTIWNGATLLRSVFVPPPGLPPENGMTVRTANIPQTVGGADGLTFRWGS
jgi:hypothetical protein